MDIALWITSALLVILGIVGTFLPGLAGAPFVFLGFLIAAWIEDFEKIGVFTLILLGILTILSIVVDFIASCLGAKRVGASKLALYGAVAGTIVGLFFGLAGILLGPFIGAVLGEYIEKRELLKAGKVGIGTWIGLLLGIAGKTAILFAMIGIFIMAYIL